MVQVKRLINQRDNAICQHFCRAVVFWLRQDQTKLITAQMVSPM
ncbi:Uncharacterised protein [Vibrio cholerae]|nr:Uncharacterised protein [Vibrio cholerae]